jgi:RHS repeat-associated protein
VHVRTKQDGSTATHSYDGAGRLLSTAFSPSTALRASAGGSQSFGYDPAGRLSSATESMNGHDSLLTLGYNALGDVVSTTQTLDGVAWQVGYAHDYARGVMTTTYPSGVQRVQEQDALGRLDAVRRGDGTLLADYAYHDLAGYDTVAYANGLTTRTDYDALGRTTQVSTGDGSTTLADYRYGYDAASNRTYTQRWHKAGQPADVYQYDGLYQFTQVWYGADATTPGAITSYDRLQWYDLDSLANRLEMQNDGVSQIYLPNDGQRLTDPMNRYQQVDADPFSYDLRGNTLADVVNTYGYDLLNRQVSASGPGGTAEYIYDALGRRLAKVVDGNTTIYIYDTRDQILEERAGDGTLAARYTHGAGNDEPLTLERGGNTYTYHRDAQNSITEVSDGTGTLVEGYEYDIHGEPYVFDGAGSPLGGSAISNPYLYTGRRYDPESGNYSFRARLYAPWIGRFLQMDPTGYTAGMNLYASYFMAKDSIHYVKLDSLTSQSAVPCYRIRNIPIGGGRNSIRCEGGKLKIYIGEPWASKLANACIRVHERQHKKDWEKFYGKNVCKGVPNGHLPIGGKGYKKMLDKSECAAFTASKKCAEDKLKTCKKPGDKRALKSVKKFSEQQIKSFCR